MLRLFLIFAFVPCLFGQLDDGTITITASRPVNAVPSDVRITVYVDMPPDTNIEQVAATVQPAGITAADLASVYNYAGYTEWIFNRTVSIAQMAGESKILDGIARDLAAKNVPNVALRSYISSSSSPDPAACPLPALVSDARSQAQRMADVAGLRVGPILALSDRGTQSASVIAILDPLTGVPSSAVRSGDFSSTAGLLSASFLLGQVPTATAPYCAISVQFQLLH